jgi:hypothetical protein
MLVYSVSIVEFTKQCETHRDSPTFCSAIEATYVLKIIIDPKVRIKVDKRIQKLLLSIIKKLKTFVIVA